MRVISGAFRGLKLNTFKGDAIRPTADRIKESLFNILSTRIAGARVLDLFAGSGSLGIECLSRGAAHVDFNDASPQSVRLLKSNLSKLKGELSFSVTVGDYSSLLMRAGAPYDVIFIDPPYASESGRAALQTIASRSLLARGGVAVYERDRAFSGDIPGLAVSDERKYGITYLTFFENEGDI